MQQDEEQQEEERQEEQQVAQELPENWWDLDTFHEFRERGFLIDRVSFSILLRELSTKISDAKWQESAVYAIQQATEEYASDMFHPGSLLQRRVEMRRSACTAERRAALQVLMRFQLDEVMLREKILEMARLW